MKEIQSHLQAAIGYLELGMVEDAANEIECLPQEHKNSSPVLGVRLEIYRTANQWSLMEVVARELWNRYSDDPVYWNDLAWAVRHAKSLESANGILLQAVEKFPEDALTHFNLGCYACQLGDVEQAKTRVGKAIELDAKFKLLALDDADLEPLWDNMKQK
jgi:tetratricopeptide (TPR) repeat protein